MRALLDSNAENSQQDEYGYTHLREELFRWTYSNRSSLLREGNTNHDAASSPKVNCATPFHPQVFLHHQGVEKYDWSRNCLEDLRSATPWTEKI